MPRWEPHARERLEAAALDLFETQGYETTTVADIASRAQVTSRTLFRHFADKREMLFGNAAQVHSRITEALGEMPSDVGALDACLASLKACEPLFRRETHDFLRRRASVVAGTQELQDREARKLRAIAGDLATALQRRGLHPREAATIADYATFIVFTHASEMWTDDPGTPFAAAIDGAHDHARALLAPPAGANS